MPPRLASAPANRRDEALDIAVAGRPVVALLPADRRVRVGLVMPVVDRVVDVSVQPTSATIALEEAARRAQTPMTSVERAARRMLVDAAARSDAWAPTAEMCLVRAFGGVAFPLLAAAYGQGGAPLREVPRWAEPVLAATTIGEGAVVAFGAAATRPVRRTLVAAIRPLPTGEIDLTALGLALMARDVLEPDQLARLLCAERVPQPNSQLPDRSTMRAARLVLVGWGPARTERVLTEAAGRADGSAVLLEIIQYARQLGDHGPAQPLPNRLDELHDVHRALMRTATATATATAATATATATATARPTLPGHAPPPAPRRRRTPHRVLTPPVASRAVGPHTPIPTPHAVRALDGRRAGDLAFVVPRTVGDLERWGRLLSNCLADFASATVTGRSVLVGVLRASRLVYVIELTPTGSIRQFCGRANRRPTERDHRTVVEAMAAAGVLDRGTSGNTADRNGA